VYDITKVFNFWSTQSESTTSGMYSTASQTYSYALITWKSCSAPWCGWMK